MANSNKRVRRDTNTMKLKLSDLPEGLLPKVASYLSNISCISFAMSMTLSSLFSSDVLPSVMSKTIATASVEDWDIVDFKDIQDICGRNLTDDDVRWILLAMDGVNKIKSLKLTNCIAITGVGLEPLTGSIVLERIDLSLVGDHENPTITPEPPISVSIVVPILNSIIEREDNVLVHVQLPKKWRVERSDVLTRFLQRFDIVLTRRRCECSRCDRICEGDWRQDYESLFNKLVHWQECRFKGYERYGMVAMSCFQCKENFCLRCGWNGEGASYCMRCEKFYCQGCNAVEHCEGNCTTCHQASTCAVCNTFKWCDLCQEAKCCEDCEYCEGCEREEMDVIDFVR